MHYLALSSRRILRRLLHSTVVILDSGVSRILRKGLLYGDIKTIIKKFGLLLLEKEIKR